MAESTPEDVLAQFENTVIHDDTEVGQVFAADVETTVRDFIRKPHTTEERKRFLHGVKDVVKTLDKDIDRKKYMKAELQEVRIKVMEDLLETEEEQQNSNPNLLRPVPARAKAQEGSDSGCYSATSADLRLFTENDQLVTTPSNEDCNT